MNLYKFFTSLKLLHCNSVPRYPDIPDFKNIIYWGVVSGGKMSDKVKDVKAENKYMVFTSLSSLEPHITDVTELDNYIEELKIESKINDIIYFVPDSFAHAIIYEAIWLIDLIYTIDHKDTFLTHFDGGLPQLIALLDNNITEGSPVFNDFEYPFAKDIFLAQSIYFIIKYCNYRLTDYSNAFSGDLLKIQAIPDEIADADTFFNKLLLKIIMQYYEHMPIDHWKVGIQTGINNTDLDFILQQIFLISQMPDE